TALVWFIVTIRALEPPLAGHALNIGIVFAALGLTVSAGQTLLRASEWNWGGVAPIQTQVRSLYAQRSGACSDTVFTYSGAYIVGTGFGLADGNEAGVFWRRVDGHVDPKFLKPEFGIDESVLRPFDFHKQPKRQIYLVGEYPEYETEIESYAQTAGFDAVVVGQGPSGPMTMWFDPVCFQ
ncbi:MAG: hypothetical protein AAGL49_14270, partial [Pseudomonadota bacterium]